MVLKKVIPIIIVLVVLGGLFIYFQTDKVSESPAEEQSCWMPDLPWALPDSGDPYYYPEYLGSDVDPDCYAWGVLVKDECRDCCLRKLVECDNAAGSYQVSPGGYGFINPDCLRQNSACNRDCTENFNEYVQICIGSG